MTDDNGTNVNALPRRVLREWPGSSLKLAVVASLVHFCLGSASQAHETKVEPASAENRVIETLNSNATAFERGDLDALNRLWVNDETVVVFENGHANHGWVDYRDHHLVPEMAEMKNVRYKLADLHPHVEGEMAWATFTYTISADVGERHVEGGGVGTAVLEKIGTEWRIVHWHTSSPRRPPANGGAEKKP